MVGPVVVVGSVLVVIRMSTGAGISPLPPATGSMDYLACGEAHRWDAVVSAPRRAHSGAAADRCASVPLRCLVVVRPRPAVSRGRSCRGYPGYRPTPTARSSPAVDRLTRGPTAQPGLDRYPASRDFRTPLPSAPEVPVEPFAAQRCKTRRQRGHRRVVEAIAGEIFCSATRSVGARGRGHRGSRATTDRRVQLHRPAHCVNTDRQRRESDVPLGDASVQDGRIEPDSVVVDAQGYGVGRSCKADPHGGCPRILVCVGEQFAGRPVQQGL